MTPIVDPTGQPARPERARPVRAGKWAISPTNGQDALDRQIVVEARSGQWHELAKLAAFVTEGLRNSCAVSRPPNVAGYRLLVFAEVDSADAQVAEKVIKGAFTQAGFGQLEVRHIGMERVKLYHTKNGQVPPEVELEGFGEPPEASDS